MRLIITRHGETLENQQGIMQGHIPGILSKEGIIQAQKLAKRLSTEKIDVIYSSDLARGADTAREIAKYHPHLKIKLVQELRERNLGELNGAKKSDLGLDENKFYATSLGPKNGESLEQLYQRAKKFLDEVLHQHKKETVLFVGHNGINKALIAVITNKTSADLPHIENHKNTSVNIYEIDEDRKHKIILFNCIKHLE